MLLVALVVAIAITTPWHVFDAVRAADAFAPLSTGDFTVAEAERAAAYRRAIRPASYIALALGVIVPVVLALSPLGRRVVAAVARGRAARWGWQTLLGAVALLLLSRLVTLPVSVYGYRLQRRYGLSTQTVLGWLADAAGRFAVGAAATALGLLALVALARALPRVWVLAAAGLAAVAVVLGSYAYPVVVEPIFNRFEPSTAEPLRTDLLELAARQGVVVDDVLVADASRRTTSLNAYVSGLGSTRRLVVYDTLLAETPPAQVESIVAHELGHVVEADVAHGTLVGALGAALGACVVAGALGWPRLRRRAGLPEDRRMDARAVPLVLAVLAVGQLVAAPVTNLVSRHLEVRADLNALDLTRDPESFALVQRRLAVTNLAGLAPDRVGTLLFASHPSPTQRIAVARWWASEHDVDLPGALATVEDPP